ncbi:MAG: aldo/keto reductase [Acidobacteria bacterium]|nr:aldo/keto reductase [Acidobacteriota bacterium]
MSRRIGPFTVSSIGLGCMNLSHAYSAPPSAETAETVIRTAIDRGVTHFDTAALYGFGANEELLGRVLKKCRADVVLASKCGIWKDEKGVRVIDGRPATLVRACDDSLRRLQTDVIDLYYLHRMDAKVPIEESVGALADLVQAGKIRTIGLSEVSAATLRRAYAVHPIAAIQSEYSLWTRNPEIAVLDACRELDVAFVAFSPLARGFLCGALRDPATELEPKDIRRAMPRFYAENYPRNLQLLGEYGRIADEAGCTWPQLALAWLLAKAPHIVPIPGTRHPAHAIENIEAQRVQLAPGVIAALEALINQQTVVGQRYNEPTQREIDTEEF